MHARITVRRVTRDARSSLAGAQAPQEAARRARLPSHDLKLDERDDDIANEIGADLRRRREHDFLRSAKRRVRKTFGAKRDMRPRWDAFLRAWRELWDAVSLREGLHQSHVTSDGMKPLCGDRSIRPETIVPIAEAKSVRWWCGRCRKVARARGVRVLDEFEQFGARSL